jgi:Transposase
LKRYYLGVDWADEFHQVWIGDEEGKKVMVTNLAQKADALSEFGRWLEECRAQGIELWAGIEKPQGRIVDFLLDHGVVVYPINPKALDRARDRFRMSQSKSDCFDAYVLAQFVRTDHGHLRALEPDSDKAQELKLFTRDHHRLGRHKTRILNLLDGTLKEYYPRPLEVFADLESKLALDFLRKYPTPEALSKLSRKEWNRFATREHHLSKERCEKLWTELNKPQLKVPEHVVRAKSQLLVVLVAQLKALSEAVDIYSEKVQRFFASIPAADLAKTLPGAKSGTTIVLLWAELGDAKTPIES